MPDRAQKLAQILGTSLEALLEVDQKMSAVTGKQGVLDEISAQNDTAVDRVLADLRLNRQSTADEVYGALTEKLMAIDQKLFEFLGKPDLSKLSDNPGKLRDVAYQVLESAQSLPAGRQGLFIKKEKVTELLKKDPP